MPERWDEMNKMKHKPESFKCIIRHAVIIFDDCVVSLYLKQRLKGVSVTVFEVIHPPCHCVLANFHSCSVTLLNHHLVRSAVCNTNVLGFSKQTPTWWASTCAAPHRSASRGWVGGPRLWMVLFGVAWREWEALCSLCSIVCRQRGRWNQRRRR